MIREDEIQLDDIQPAPVSPTAGERFEAGWDKATVETGMFGHEASVAAGLISEIRAKLPDGAYGRLHDEIGLPRLSREQQYTAILAEASKHAAYGPDNQEWADVPLTLEAFTEEVNRRRREEYDEADEVLGIDGPGLAGFAGSMARYIADPVNIATLPFAAGRGASLGKIMLTEALLNAAAEAGSLPREFQVARELGLPAPNPALRIAAGAAIGGGLGGAIAGAPRAFSAAQRGATRAATYLSLDRAMLRARTPRGVDPTDFEARVDGEAARGAGEDDPVRTALEAAPARPDAQTPTATTPTAPAATSQIAFDYVGSQTGIDPATLTAVREAVFAVEGNNVREIVITSGADGHSRNHRGPAMDIRIVRQDGSVIRWDDPSMKAITVEAVRRGVRQIGLGPGYMGGDHVHIGVKTPGYDTDSRVRIWNDDPDRNPNNPYIPGRGITAWNDELQAALNNPIAAAPLGRPLTMQDFDFGPSGNASPRVNRVGYVYGQLLARGYDPQTAAALVGNAMQESGPGLNTRAIGDGGNAFGMGQWNGPRKAALERFAAERGKDPADIDTQIDFWHWELQNTERAALDAIIAAPDVASAARIASEQFWRPGIPHIERRVAYASTVFDQFNTGQVPRWTGAAVSDAAYGTTTGTTSRGYTRTGQVRVGDGTFLDVDYQVVDIDELMQATGNLQPRDRSRAASDDWVAATAARLDPALLMPSPTADRGAPLIGPDNIIESGNGRVRAIQRAYEQGLDRAGAYRDQIEGAGFTIPNGVERPVLIARRTTELDDAARRQMVIDAQDSGVVRMNATERAEVGERALSADMLQRFDPTKPLTDAANRDFARGFTDFFPASERGAFIAADKSLSIDGVRQIQDAMFARAWAAPDIVGRAVEAQPGDLKSLFDALASAAPDFAILRAEIEAGLVRADMDISAHVLEAVRLIVEARDLAASGQGKAAQILEDLLADTDLLDGPWSPLTRALVHKFTADGRVASAKSISDFLSRYAREARQAGREGDAFGGAGPLDVLKTIDRKAFGQLESTGSPRIPLADRNAAPEPVVDTPPRGMFDDGATSPETMAANDALEADVRRATQRPAGGDLAARAPDTPRGADAAPDPLPAARGDEIAEVEAQANRMEELLRYDAELRGLDLDEIEVKFEDGTTFSAREVLDEIDEDRAFADIIDLCAGRAG